MFYKIAGFMIIVIGFIGATYAGLGFMLVGGLGQIIEATKATEISSHDIVIGVIRMILSIVAIYGCFIGIVIPGFKVWDKSKKRRG